MLLSLTVLVTLSDKKNRQDVGQSFSNKFSYTCLDSAGKNNYLLAVTLTRTCDKLPNENIKFSFSPFCLRKNSLATSELTGTSAPFLLDNLQGRGGSGARWHLYSCGFVMI